jgi:hypothetical protein
MKIYIVININGSLFEPLPFLILIIVHYTRSVKFIFFARRFKERYGYRTVLCLKFRVPEAFRAVLKFCFLVG